MEKNWKKEILLFCQREFYATCIFRLIKDYLWSIDNEWTAGNILLLTHSNVQISLHK